jgi:outer membrane protein TolC
MTMALLLMAVSQVGSMERVSFEEAVARAAAQAPRVGAIRASIQRAEALVVQSRAAWLPTLVANGVFTQLESNRSLGDRVLLPAQSATANVQLTFPLLAVPRWLATADAEALAKASRLDEGDVQRTLAGIVGRAWLTVSLQQRLCAIAERATSTSEQQVEWAQVRVAGGLGTKLDLARARREQADNEGRLARARAELSLAQEVLGVLVGSDHPLDVSGEPSLPPFLQGDVESVVGARPDVQAAAERLMVANRAFHRSWVDALPTVNAVVQPTAQTPPTPTQPAIGVLGQLQAQLPLFDGFSRRGLEQERQALAGLAKAQLDDVTQRARSEVRLALEVLKHRQTSTKAAVSAAKWAQEAEALARVAWKEGSSTNVELIEAERAARDAESLAEGARINELAARVDALVAQGRWPAEQERLR